MPRLFLIIVACFALFAVAGCGDDSATTSSAPAETTAPEESPQAEEEALAEKEADEAEEAEAEAEELAELPNVPSGPPPKKLVIEDVKAGSGPAAKAGDKVTVHYIGVLYKGGDLFDANWEDDEPFSFTLGKGEVIPGWDKGVQGMKVGGQRELILPPALAYGTEGVYPSIPPNSTLVFLVELLDVK